MALQWKGVIPALTTPFNENDEVDLQIFGKNLQLQVDAGVNGVIIAGSLGEASTLTIAEKEQLVKFAIEKLAGKIPVILNIAEGNTKEAIIQMNNAMKWGADGLMLLPAMRYKTDHRETVTWFSSLAKSTDLPIMIYNNPVDYKCDVTLQAFEELSSYENIQAVKESTRDVTNVSRMINRFGKRFKIFCGVDTLAMEELVLGADGWVAGLVCAFPRETVAIYNHIKSGNIEKAAEIYRWFMPLLELDIHPKLVQYIKLVQSQVGNGSENVRAPRLKIEGDERQEILRILETAVSNRPQL